MLMWVPAGKGRSVTDLIYILIILNTIQFISLIDPSNTISFITGI